MSTGTTKIVNLGGGGIGDIGSLPEATELNSDDLLLIKQSENKKLPAALLPGGAGFRIDEFTYNETTELFENVVDTYQDVLAYAKAAVVDGSNVVKYFLDPTDFRFKENGEAANVYGFTADTVKNIGGTDYTVYAADFGNVVIRFPKMYYSHRYHNSKHTWRQSMYNFAGSQVHPSFRRHDATAGEVVEVDHANIGRYEGVLFDASANKCVNGVYIDEDVTSEAATKTITFAVAAQYLATGDKLKDTSGVLGAANAVYTADAVTRDANQQTTSLTVLEAVNDVAVATTIALRNDIDLVNDKLMSVSGYKPLTYISQTEARQLSGNNGAKYSQQVYCDWFLIQLLAAVKFSTLNIQTALGPGKTSSTSNYKYVSVTGLADSAGMANFIDNTNDLEFAGGSSIFGLEMTWCNLFKWIDGLNDNDWVLSLSVDNSQFDVPGSYENTGIELSHANGYWKKMVNTDKGMFPASNDGDSANAVGDYYYQSTGSRVGLVSGDLSAGASAGLAFFYGAASAANRYWSIGARVRS